MARLWAAPTLLWQLIVAIGCEKKPDPVHCGGPPTTKMAPDDMALYSAWTPQSRQNLWEMSGQLEGDIMVEGVGESVGAGRNAVLDASRLWPAATVPYYVDPDHFGEEESAVIRGAMRAVERRTCVRFRPYRRGDSAYVAVRGDRPGCWSYVGRRDGGQTVNLGDKCVRHGIAVHEMLHALGLHHQQSSSDRDDYVTVHWDNIEPEHKHNFDKYNSSAVTDYGVGYDYFSIMHYSAYAFSKNDKTTISAKEAGVKLAQQSSLSEKDVKKLNAMYGCSGPATSEPGPLAPLGLLAAIFPKTNAEE